MKRVGKEKEATMEGFGKPHGHSYNSGRVGGGVAFNGINQSATAEQMYVARSRRRGQPPALHKTRLGSSSSLVSSITACLNDPEAQRKRRVAKYNSYSTEGKVKNTFKKGYRWIKRKFLLAVHGN